MFAHFNLNNMSLALPIVKIISGVNGTRWEKILHHLRIHRRTSAMKLNLSSQECGDGLFAGAERLVNQKKNISMKPSFLQIVIFNASSRCLF